jgi:hypothetical protein
LGHITHESSPTRAALLAAALGATLALGGCGGVQFEGKVFDYMGVSSIGGQQADVKMVERPPLLLPPDTKALPPPSQGVAVATARADWPQNPEVAQEQVIQAKKDERFKEEAKRQPLNPYIGKPNLFTRWFQKPKQADLLEDVPEPDPSDKAPEGGAVAQTTTPKPLTPPVPDAEIPDDSLFHPTAPDTYKNPNAYY